MSRSFKKTPIIKEHIPGMKSTANRKVRRENFNITNGNSYRKVFCSYDISDYAFRMTYAEYCARTEQHEKDFENDVDFRYGKVFIDERSHWDWYKTYKRK